MKRDENVGTVTAHEDGKKLWNKGGGAPSRGGKLFQEPRREKPLGTQRYSDP